MPFWTWHGKVSPQRVGQHLEALFACGVVVADIPWIMKKLSTIPPVMKDLSDEIHRVFTAHNVDLRRQN
jgi:hypothetical protein